MWVFTNTAFVSAVCHRTQPGMLMVRARLQGDLENFLASDGAPLTVEETADADYRYRCTVPVPVFAAALEKAARSVDYDNFKGSIDPSDRQRHDAYLDVWAVMHRVQVEGTRKS